MYDCTIWILEGITGNRPGVFANWNKEIKFKLNDKDCTAPDCSIVETGAMYWAVIRAKNVLGSQCRKEKVKVSMEVNPLPDPRGHTCNERCEVKGYKGFDSRE